jgi:protein TonB
MAETAAIERELSGKGGAAIARADSGPILAPLLDARAEFALRPLQASGPARPPLIALGVSLAAHGALFAALAWFASSSPPLDGAVEIPVEIVVEAPAETRAVAEPPAPVEPPPAAVAPSPPPTPAEATPPPAAEPPPPPPPPPPVETPPPAAVAPPPPPTLPEATPLPAIEPLPPPPPPVETPPPAAVAPPPLPTLPEATPLPAIEPLPPPPAQTLPPPKPELPPAPKAAPRPQPKPQPKPAPARPAATEPAAAPKSAALSPAAPKADLGAYRASLYARIYSAVRYPESARERGAVGVAVVSFSFDATGQVTSAALAQSSGDAALDADAVASVRRASPLPPPPEGAPRAYAVPIRYRLR